LIKLDALILAGGKTPPDDPLFDECPNGSRSLMTLHGKPMVQWVIDALDASEAVADLYVIGLSEEFGLSATKPIHYLPDQGDMFENIRNGAIHTYNNRPEREKILLASSDIPAIQPQMVDWLASQIAADPAKMLYYNVITQQTMEERFPNASRSYVRFKDVAVCGGDLNAIDKRLFTIERPLWHKLTTARKHPLRQAGMIGFDTLLLIALRLITLESAVKKVCRRLNLDAKALLCPYAEMGMDADKPHQLAILRQHLGEGL
jgi:molybdopterin-guanine dinucleotide biosynthesis protein A